MRCGNCGAEKACLGKRALMPAMAVAQERASCCCCAHSGAGREPRPLFVSGAGAEALARARSLLEGRYPTWRKSELEEPRQARRGSVSACHWLEGRGAIGCQVRALSWHSGHAALRGPSPVRVRSPEAPFARALPRPQPSKERAHSASWGAPEKQRRAGAQQQSEGLRRTRRTGHNQTAEGARPSTGGSRRTAQQGLPGERAEASRHGPSGDCVLRSSLSALGGASARRRGACKAHCIGSGRGAMEATSLRAAVNLLGNSTRCASPAVRVPAAAKAGQRSSAACRASVRTDEEGEAQFTSPKAGAVGEARFQQNASPGTYWSTDLAPTASTPQAGTRVTVEFDTGSELLSVEGVVGENLLRLAERVGALSPTEEYCFEGTCCHCEMEVEGGATEVGYRAYASTSDLVRSCICPVPSQEVVKVRVLSEEGAWSDGVL